MTGRMYTCNKFVITYKDEKYESEETYYQGDLWTDIKQSFSQGAHITNQSKKKKVERQRRKSENGGIVSSIRRKISTTNMSENTGIVSSIRRKISTTGMSENGGIVSSIRRKISTTDKIGTGGGRKMSTTDQIDNGGRRKISTTDNSEEGEIVSSIRRKISTNESVAVLTPCVEIGVNTITEGDIQLLDFDIEQNSDVVTVNVLGEIDTDWFRKSVKLFFQLLLLLDTELI